MRYLFSEYCYVVHTEIEARETIDKLCQDGLTLKQKEMLLAAANYVQENFSYSCFIKYIMLENKSMSFINNVQPIKRKS